MQRLVAGSARIGQRIAAAVNPSGSVFNDLRPPMPDEAIAGVTGTKLSWRYIAKK